MYRNRASFVFEDAEADDHGVVQRWIGVYFRDIGVWNGYT